MSLGERLIELRKEKHLSQEEAADRLKVTRQTISKWELDQSTPDFDKLVPICELYGIDVNELVTGKKKVKTDSNTLDTEEEIEKGKKRANGLAGGILLYFLAIVWISVTVAAFNMNPVLASGIFLLICGVATSIIVYTQLAYKKKQSEREIKEKKLYKQIEDICSIATVIIYLVISFLTGAWHITWLIWLVYALVMEIIKLVLSLRGDKDENI